MPSPHECCISAVIALARDDVPLLWRGHDDLSVLYLGLAQVDITCVAKEGRLIVSFELEKFK